MRNMCVILVLLLTSCVLLETREPDNLVLARSSSAINLCVDRYKQIVGEPFFDEVDRAYALVAEGKIDILFVRGESGIFGHRSENYQSFCFCGVNIKPQEQIYFLGNPFGLVHVDLENNETIQESMNPDGLWDLLYFRKGDSFTFERAQVYDTEKYEAKVSFGN